VILRASVIARIDHVADVIRAVETPVATLGEGDARGLFPFLFVREQGSFRASPSALDQA
jgi:hypothetical protein